MAIQVTKPQYTHEKHVTDPAAKRGSLWRTEPCAVTFAVSEDQPDVVGIGWGLVAGVDVHPELLVKTLQLLGYTVRKP